MGCSTSILRFLLNLFNVFFLVAGIGLLGVGIWSVVDKIYVSEIIGNRLFASASIIAIAAAVIIILVSILGIVSVILRMPRLLLAYFIIQLILFILLITAAAVAVAFRGELEQQMITAMVSTLTIRYGLERKEGSKDNGAATAAWDRLQRENQCCAVNDKGWFMYRSTPWFTLQYQALTDREFVPETCCVINPIVGRYEPSRVSKCQHFQLGPPGRPDGTFTNDALLSDGCYEKAKKFVLDQSSIIVALGFLYACLQIAGLILTFLVYQRLSREEKVPRRDVVYEEEMEKVPAYEEKHQLQESPQQRRRSRGDRYNEEGSEEEDERSYDKQRPSQRDRYNDRDRNDDKSSDRDRYSDKGRSSERDRLNEQERYSERDRNNDRGSRYSERDEDDKKERYNDRERYDDGDRYDDRPRRGQRPQPQERGKPIPKERHRRDVD